MTPLEKLEQHASKDRISGNEMLVEFFHQNFLFVHIVNIILLCSLSVAVKSKWYQPFVKLVLKGVWTIWL